MDLVNPEAGKPIERPDGRPEATASAHAPMSGVRGRAFVVLTLLVLAWVGSGLRAFTVEAQATVLVPALIVAVIVLARPSSRIAPAPPVRLGFRWWGVLLLAGLLWEAYAFFQQPAPTTPSLDHPTLSILLDPLMEHRPVRVAGWFAWMYARYRLLVSLGRGPGPRATPSGARPDLEAP